MKKNSILKLLVLLVLALVSTSAVAADAGAPAVVASQSGLEWFQANSAVILAAALALSEVLALIPALKGNGILDAIIKGLNLLIARKKASGQ